MVSNFNRSTTACSSSNPSTPPTRPTCSRGQLGFNGSANYNIRYTVPSNLQPYPRCPKTMRSNRLPATKQGVFPAEHPAAVFKTAASKQQILAACDVITAAEVGRSLEVRRFRWQVFKEHQTNFSREKFQQ